MRKSKRGGHVLVLHHMWAVYVLDATLRVFDDAKKTTVDAAAIRAQLVAHIDEDIDCPSCGQFVKRYRQPLCSSTARWLISLELIAASRPGDWIHVNEIAQHLTGSKKEPMGSGDFAKARFWGLTEEKINLDTAKRDSGLWRLTDKGRDFVHRRVKIPQRVILFNNKCEGFEGKDVSIVDVLGKKFNYSALMGLTSASP